MGILGFDIVHKETEHVAVDGKRFRSPTVLIRVRRRDFLSRKAFILGLLLVLCHLADGFLTFWGIESFGTLGERNPLVQRLVYHHGTIPGIFIAKSAGVAFSLVLIALSHKRRWVRPVLSLSIGLYIALAIVPWTMLIIRDLSFAR
jgi:hypothetical protein